MYYCAGGRHGGQAYRKFTDMSKEDIITRMKEDLSSGAQQSYYLTANRDKR